MPELVCETCGASGIAGVDDLLRSDYWPATLHFSTIFANDTFISFEESKMVAPGLSCQAFLRMLDRRTVRFGHVSIEGLWPMSFICISLLKIGVLKMYLF